MLGLAGTDRSGLALLGGGCHRAERPAAVRRARAV